jgi:hypothetical protein
VPFTVHLLSSLPDVVPSQAALRTCGEALDTLLVRMKAAPPVLSPTDIQETYHAMHDAWSNLLSLRCLCVCVQLHARARAHRPPWKHKANKL